MRKLKTCDIPVFCRALKKLGVKDQFKTIAQEANSAKEAWDRGFELLWGIFDKATEQTGEQALYEFFAGPFEMTAAEVADLDLDVLVNNMKQLIAENDLLTFFNFAAKAMK